jgi:hypothetical protein
MRDNSFHKSINHNYLYKFATSVFLILDGLSARLLLFLCSFAVNLNIGKLYSSLYNCFGDPVINSKHKFNYLISVVSTILYRFRHCIDSLRKVITLTSSRLWKRTFISINNLRGDTAFQCIWNIEIFRPLTERGISFHSF